MGNALSSQCQEAAKNATPIKQQSLEPTQDATATAEEANVPPAIALDATDAPAAVIGPPSGLEEQKPTTMNDEDFVVVEKEDKDSIAATTEEHDEQAEEELSEPGKKTIVLSTAQPDPRFPAVNQAGYCYLAYNEAHRCWKEKGEGHPDCEKYAKQYRSICPMSYVLSWNEMREDGTWFGKW